MKVTQVALIPSSASQTAGRPALTPELLAASGARYSRNNQGLESILERIDPDNLDASVDSIFRLIDYGHQSIADMAPVAMFIDSISLWLAYHVWTLCPTAGGQESSTRYIELQDADTLDADRLGIPPARRAAFYDRLREAFAGYREALDRWSRIGAACPHLTAIPAALRNDDSSTDRRTIDRMLRNYRFDRARYYLPMAASTNMMLVMSARGWVNLCQHLASHGLPEARALGTAIRAELALATPRLLKHAVAKPGTLAGQREAFEHLARTAAAEGLPSALQPDPVGDHPPAPATVQLDVLVPPDVPGDRLAADLNWHDNRYAWIGCDLRRVAVRVDWAAMAMAEIRDLNRHRTGTKTCPLRPLGFYAALEQIPDAMREHDDARRLRALAATGRGVSATAHDLLAQGDQTYVYDSLLGTQFRFEHVTTADKFIYEAELRTGLGAHFRYACHLKDALEAWYARFPETRGRILEGDAEPE